MLSLAFGISLPATVKSWTSNILGTAITLLGAGVPVQVALQNGEQGLVISLLLIAGVLSIGAFMAKLLKVEEKVGTLISSGTAICGGSAIAAVSGSIRSNAEQTGVALAIVFILNSIAMFLFPLLGHLLGLTGEQFGVWAALAIHDTSSVVGAAVAFGQGAENIAVPMKLARALWIIPVAAVLARIHSGKGKGKLPWFVFTFLGVAAAFSLIPALHDVKEPIEFAGKRLLVVVLFFIGSAITRETLRTTGWRPLALGVILWAVVSVASLMAIVTKAI
jgi:uncharacterized integral membrane protein (TIGR00698 family)